LVEIGTDLLKTFYYRHYKELIVFEDHEKFFSYVETCSSVCDGTVCHLGESITDRL
jgi:hypothetical protein